MSDVFSIGDNVKWKWGNGWGHGEVSERFTKDVTRNIKGTNVSRNATGDAPAYFIEQGDCDRVLKSHSEIQEDL